MKDSSKAIYDEVMAVLSETKGKPKMQVGIELTALIKELITKREREALERIANKAYDDMHRTYDYNLIAETLFSRIEELNTSEGGE